MALLRACSARGTVRPAHRRCLKLLSQRSLESPQVLFACSAQRLTATNANGPNGAETRLEDIANHNKEMLQLMRVEMRSLRKEVNRLTIMVEQDFVGHRRGSTAKSEDRGAFWRNSLQGANRSLSELSSTSSISDASSLVDPSSCSEPSSVSDPFSRTLTPDKDIESDPFHPDEVRPSVSTARMQPTHISEMGHSTLAALALQNNHHAHRERLIREIMCVDNCSWEDAHKVLEQMDEYKERYYWFVTAPYRLGIVIAISLGMSSMLLVFHPPSAYWYGTNVAGEDLPEGTEHVRELTINQVGTWTWSWMEPMIGTASFVLLCAQFVRAQLIRVNMKTFLHMMESRKADRTAAKFNRYDKSTVRTWAKPLPKAKTGFPIYERTLGIRGPSSGL